MCVPYLSVQCADFVTTVFSEYTCTVLKDLKVIFPGEPGWQADVLTQRMSYNNDDDDTTIYESIICPMKSLERRHTLSLCDDSCRAAPNGCRPLDQADGLEPLARL